GSALDPSIGVANVLLGKPRRMPLNVKAEIALLKQHRLAVTAQQRIAQARLQAIPAGRKCAGKVADILVIHAQHGAEAGRLHALARTLKPVFAQALPVDPLLPIHAGDTEVRSHRSPPELSAIMLPASKLTALAERSCRKR